MNRLNFRFGLFLFAVENDDATLASSRTGCTRVAGAHDLVETDGIEQKSRANLVKVGVIQNVGGLGAELFIHLFTDLCVLKQGCIPAAGTPAKNRTAWGRFPVGCRPRQIMRAAIRGQRHGGHKATNLIGM
jgi:hypothetical protein